MLFPFSVPRLLPDFILISPSASFPQIPPLSQTPPLFLLFGHILFSCPLLVTRDLEINSRLGFVSFATFCRSAIPSALRKQRYDVFPFQRSNSRAKLPRQTLSSSSVTFDPVCDLRLRADRSRRSRLKRPRPLSSVIPLCAPPSALRQFTHSHKPISPSKAKFRPPPPIRLPPFLHIDHRSIHFHSTRCLLCAEVPRRCSASWYCCTSSVLTTNAWLHVANLNQG